MGHRSTAAAAAVLVGLSASVGCGETTPERAAAGAVARVLDESTATFEGVRLSATSQRIRRRFGRPLKSPDGAATPPGVDFYDVGGPTDVQPPPSLSRAANGRGGGSLRYRETAWLVEGGRSYGVMTVADDVRTRAGVGIGDAADRVTDRYGRARCFTANEGTEYATFPLCEAKVRPGVRLYFGGDPVKSIWLIVSGDAAYRKLRDAR